MEQIAGITRERAHRGHSRYVRIDLNRYGKNENLISFFHEVGFEPEESIKWTEEMKQSFAEAERGELTEIDLNNFWNV